MHRLRHIHPSTKDQADTMPYMAKQTDDTYVCMWCNKVVVITS